MGISQIRMHNDNILKWMTEDFLALSSATSHSTLDNNSHLTLDNNSHSTLDNNSILLSRLCKYCTLEWNLMILLIIPFNFKLILRGSRD
ncbi:hypothetical protein Glove_103g277 [Diversispora epigaea]|uniref:Uncharacterized protein n=1 Tax=Diversispora epigaea TaxID=1348612 RepID=A0A397J7R1_9GLOM|nr:hypothetical protein Glove_103g277 [Diversispora epigaea]